MGAFLPVLSYSHVASVYFAVSYIYTSDNTVEHTTYIYSLFEIQPRRASPGLFRVPYVFDRFDLFASLRIHSKLA